MKFVDTNYIIQELYPLVKAKLDSSAIQSRFLRGISEFFNKKHTQIYDIAPYTNIYFNKEDEARLYKSIDMTQEEILAVIKKCWFWDWDPGYRPKCAKEPYVQMLFCAVRYFIEKKDLVHAEMVTIFICFSGKFYASIYSSMWKYPVNPAVMDYVVNNMLSDKYDLKKEGSIFKAIKKLSNTWLEKYSKDLADKTLSDDEMGKLMQQLRDRVKSFLKNIYGPYLEAAENKYYQNYETDNVESDTFRLTDNDSAKASRATEAAMSIISSQKVSVKYCNNARDQRVSANQIKDILESIILYEKSNLNQVRRVINILICEYLAQSKSKIINSIEFLEYAITPKPNTKDPLLLEMKNIVLNWLDQDETYRRRKRTPATANSYYKAIMSYLAQVIMQGSSNL